MKVNNCQTCDQPMSAASETLNLDCSGDSIERLTGEKVDSRGRTYYSYNVKGQL